MEAIPRFLNGVYHFKGSGYEQATPVSDQLVYTVPSDKRAQLIYLRAGKPMRYFPIGAKCSEHVPLAVVEDLFPETKLEVTLAAPSGAAGHLVLDIGLLEI
jgi:hypothetical protein